MKRGFLKKLLLFMLVTLIITAVLTGAVFTYTSRNVFARIKANEMVPRAAFISGMVSQYLRGELSAQSFERMLNNDKSLWDATVHIFDSDGEVIARTSGRDEKSISGYLTPYVTEMLSGNSEIVVTSSAELGLIVGTPVYGVDASIEGAVFLTKPLMEVNAAMNGMNTALLISVIAAFCILVPFAYLGTRSITKPLLQMSLAARAMAQGDFSVRADEARRDEVGQVGKALNELSSALSHTIGDLMLERNRLRNVLDGLREGIVALDCAGSVTHCNPAASQLIGSSLNDPQSAYTRLRELWPEIHSAIESNDGGTHTVACGRAQLKLTVSHISGQGDCRAGAVTLIQDVTEEMRLEQTRRDYVANVSHELRTPISSIRSLADALNDGLVKREEDKVRYYGYILRESMRLSRLINDLLELSRLQSGGVALERRPFKLQPLLLEMAERFETTAEDSGLHFAVYMPEEELTVISNEDRVEQVLVALLDNAVKYSSDEGLVTLAVERGEAGLTVSVCNTGNIAEEHLPHLFDRFYKADTAHAEQGTGLGLAIAREIMLLLGERIWAENASGEACFRFTLHEQDA